MPPIDCRLSPVAVTITSAATISPTFQAHAARDEAIDLAGHDTRAAILDGFEDIAVRREAEPLIPGIVAGREMLRDHLGRTGDLAARVEQALADLVGLATAHGEEVKPLQRRFPARDEACGGDRKPLAHRVGERVHIRPWHDVAWRTLEHRHVRRRLGQRRQQ